MSTNETDVVLSLIALAEAEEPPGRIRNRLRELSVDVTEAPALVYEQLAALASEQTADLTTQLPSSTLYRAVAVDTYQRYCVSEDWRPPMVGQEEFRRYVESKPDPDQFLRSILSAATVFPPDHSWLIRSANIESLNGRALVAALRLDKQEPPFILCRLTVDRMIKVGVRIRKPTAYDAILGRHTIWSPSGVPGGDEFVDLDIPGAAVEVTLWRP